MAGAEGLEPTFTVLETVVLPLNYTPMALVAGFEPATYRLTADCSTTKLHQNVYKMLDIGFEPTTH